MDFKISVSTIFVAIAILGYLNWIVFTDYQDTNLTIEFLNVGQGDMSLIKTPNHHTIIVDGGPNKDAIYKLEEKLPFYDRTIDLIILTHSDLDHLNGLLRIVQDYQVGLILLSGAQAKTATYLDFLNIIKQRNIPIMFAESKQDFYFEDEVFIDILYPKDNSKLKVFENLNNSSIVFNLHYKDKKIIFLGDIETDMHPTLLETKEKLRANLVKISHHGAKNGTSEELIAAIRPDEAILSYGIDNKFKHPHQETLDILNNHKIKICETKNNNCKYLY